MKKLLVTLVAGLMALSMVGCGTDTTAADEPAKEEPAAEATDAAEETTELVYADVYAAIGAAEVDLSAADGKLAEILEKGEIVVGTSPDYPPAEYIDVATGEVKGSEMMIAKYIANSFGVELKIETMDFSGVLTAVDTDKVDVAISGFGYKEDRAANYELSHGYQYGSSAAHHTILIPAADLDQYNSLEDFNKEGLVIDCQANSLQEMYATDELPNAEKTKVATLDQAILDILAGKVNAVALDSTTAKNYAEQSNGQLVSVYVEKGIEFDLSPYADYSGNVMACKKGETSLMDALNQVIDTLVAEGLYSDWYLASCYDAGVEPNEE